jgi:hypothetical protein
VSAFSHTVNALPGEEGPDCLLCAVRELTEGTPTVWAATAAGQTVSGVVLRTGMTEGFGGYREVRYVDLWTGGWGRIRIVAFAAMLENAIKLADAKVGDRLSVTYEGQAYVTKGRFEGRPYKKFSADIRRGHH